MGMTWLAMSVPTLAILSASPALATGPACPAVTVEAEPDLRARWPGLPEQVKEVFDARDDIDGCARVRLATRGRQIEIEVWLPDGRATTRSVARREDVVPTLSALLIVPERPEPATEAEPTALPPPSAAASTPAARPAAPVAMAAARDSPPPSVQPPASAEGVGVELSITTGVRIGDDQAGMVFGIRSFVEIASWLAGFEARVDGYRTLDGQRSAEALELALRAGRRFRSGTLSLDISVGPALALMGSTSTSPAEPEQISTANASELESIHGLAPRALLAAYLNLGADASLRWFVGVDGELGATHGVGDDLPSDVPRLPSWTVGLALGATVGTL